MNKSEREAATHPDGWKSILLDNTPLTKSKAFALRIIKVCNEVKREHIESILTNQLIRSGTSIGANIRKAFYAHGRADFAAKLQIARKECSESEYWLELLIESGFYSDSSILNDCIEIKKLLIASINTTKANMKRGCFENPGRDGSTENHGI